MKNENVEVKFVKTWSEDEIVKLYKAGGWWKETYDKSKLSELISGSFAFAVIVFTETKKTIGMGRIISDGVSDAYIQDLVLLPEFRGKGLGKKLVRSLINYCLDKNITWIGLIAEPGSEEFYNEVGLESMKNHVPMKYKLSGKND